MAGARILIVEDNVYNRELMSYLLTAFGHTILVAETVRDGIDLACGYAPDLIVCDVQLPDIDGFELARELHLEPLTRAIPLVAVTALAMVGDRERVLAAGYDGYLPKPIDPETFVQDIEAFLPPERRSTGCHAQAREH